MHLPNGARARLWNLAYAISRLPLPGRIRRGAIFQALRALALAVLQRVLTLGRPQLWDDLWDLFRRLPDVDWLLVLLLEYYPSLLSSGPLTEDLARKGLGARGDCPIPASIWDRVVPASLLGRLKSFCPEGPLAVRPLNYLTAIMVEKLFDDGFLLPLPMDCS